MTTTKAPTSMTERSLFNLFGSPPALMPAGKPVQELLAALRASWPDAVQSALDGSQDGAQPRQAGRLLETGLQAWAQQTQAGCEQEKADLWSSIRKLEGQITSLQRELQTAGQNARQLQAELENQQAVNRAQERYISQQNRIIAEQHQQISNLFGGENA